MKKAKPFPAPRLEDIDASITACLENAQRLIDDAEYLEFQDSGASRLALSMLAQEECAKAFVLYMVRTELVPWDASLLRIIRNHACKHLVALIIEYIDPDWDTIEDLKANIEAEYNLEGRFPPHISSALNILYFEKIRGENFLYNNEYELDVVNIAKGERDRVKQDAVYVDLDKSCRVKKLPAKITQADAEKEQDRAKHYKSAVKQLLVPDAYERLQLSKLREAMKAVYWQHYKRELKAPDS